MTSEKNQFGNSQNEAFPGERPYVDQIAYGKPLDSDEAAAQQRAIDQHKAKKRRKFGWGVSKVLGN